MKATYVFRCLLSGFFLLIAENGFSQYLVSDYLYQPVEIGWVKIVDRFWLPRMDVNRLQTIPRAFRTCEESGKIDRFAVAAGKKQGMSEGNPFDDSDVYKLIEAACYSLQQRYNAQLDAYLDSIIGLVAAAQEKDGYLYTASSMKAPRWANEPERNELYNAGRLYEAAVAHYQATQKKTLLDVAVRNADLVCKTFGPDRWCLVPGFEGIEQALVRLYRVTKNIRYLNTANFFVEERGDAHRRDLYEREGDRTFFQDNMPIVLQTKATGNAARAAGLYSAVTDLAAIRNDLSYRKAAERIWLNMVGSKLYLTGGIGFGRDSETFGHDYELPNDSSGSAIGASVANMLWNYRMFLTHGEAKYMDVFEQTLYNAFLSSVSIDGRNFFRNSSLSSKGDLRSLDADSPSCSADVAWFMASLPGYVYAQRDSNIYVNLFISSEATFQFGKQRVKIEQRTKYPWNGSDKLTVYAPNNYRMKICIRLPGWSRNVPVPSNLYAYADGHLVFPVEIRVNGQKQRYLVRNGYAVIDRAWKFNDVIDLTFPMHVRRVVANNNVEATRDCEAYQRGPLVYCFEEADNAFGLRNVSVENKKWIRYRFEPNTLKGVGVLRFDGTQKRNKKNSNEEYKKNVRLKAIPYFAWANRTRGAMTVWLPCTVSLGCNPQTIGLNTWRFKTGDNPEWAKAEFDDSNWKDIQVGKPWEAQGYDNYNGYAWYRAGFRLSSEMKKYAVSDSIVVNLGKIDDCDQTFLNGKLLGENARLVTRNVSDNAFSGEKAWNTPRMYKVSVNDSCLNWDKDNVLSVRVFDSGGNGGLVSFSVCVGPDCVR